MTDEVTAIDKMRRSDALDYKDRSALERYSNGKGYPNKNDKDNGSDKDSGSEE